MSYNEAVALIESTHTMDDPAGVVSAESEVLALLSPGNIGVIALDDKLDADTRGVAARMCIEHAEQICPYMLELMLTRGPKLVRLGVAEGYERRFGDG